MSWEAWGTPPDQEPELCPICDNTQHTPDKCEIAASEAHSRAHYEGVIALLLQDRERKLTNAYAEGRKDEAEDQAARRAEGADKLHDAIMNLPCDASRANTVLLSAPMAYAIGHRDARHAAAERALSVIPEQPVASHLAVSPAVSPQAGSPDGEGGSIYGAEALVCATCKRPFYACDHPQGSSNG